MRRFHLPFLACEIVLAALLLALTLVVKRHPGPLPGDVGVEVDVQHALLPHAILRDPVEAVSALYFPLPTIVTLAVIVAIFLLLRRWLDAILAPIAAGIAGGLNTLIKDWVHRPRASGYGIQVVQHITTSYSFPSGHVVYIVTVYGLFLFLSTQVRHPFHPALVWLIRVAALVLILLMPVSRVLEGEHWPSDTLGGGLEGLFVLVIFAHVYLWARSRWPVLVAPDER